MAVTEDQVAELRAYLSAGTHAEASDPGCQFLTLSKPGRLDEAGVLVYGTVAAA